MDDDIYDAMRGVHEELLGSKFHRAMCLFRAHILNIIWCHISITILEWHSMISTVKNISIRDINVQYTLSNILRNSPWMHKSYAHISREAESWQKWRRAEMITKCIMVWQHFCNKLRSVCYASATYLHIYLPLLPLIDQKIQRGRELFHSIIVNHIFLCTRTVFPLCDRPF